MPRSRSQRRARIAEPPIAAPLHHAQARISEDVRAALEQIAAERGVTTSEIVRDAIEAYLFGSTAGATIAGPDNGYRVAKSTASVIARKMLFVAYKALPQTWAEFKAWCEQEGVELP